MKTVEELGQSTCPKCHSDRDGGSILEEFIKQREAGVNFTVMKTIIRWYYRVFQKDRCYKATLQDRLRNRWDCVDCCDKYIGADWWLRP